MSELTIQLDNFNTVLKTNENYVNTYNAKLEEALKRVKEELTEEQDSDLLKLSLSAKKAKTAMNDSRSVYTRKFDEIKGMFTAQEAGIQSVIDKVQQKRDASAKLVLNKERKIAEVEVLEKFVSDKLRELYMNELAEDVNTIHALNGNIEDAKPAFSQTRFALLVSKIVVKSAYGNDVEEIVKKSIEGKYEILQAHYLKAINEAIANPKPKAETVAVPVAVVSTPIATPKGVKEKLSLTVLSDIGWLNIVQMYFRDNTGLDGKVTLERMRKHAENVANKTGELIESGVEYEELVKATNAKK